MLSAICYLLASLQGIKFPTCEKASESLVGMLPEKGVKEEVYLGIPITFSLKFSTRKFTRLGVRKPGRLGPILMFWI